MVISMTDWQDRLVREERELAEKIMKLTHFFQTETYQELGSYDRLLLSTQLDYMSGYQRVLSKRISWYEHATEPLEGCQIVGQTGGPGDSTQ